MTGALRSRREGRQRGIGSHRVLGIRELSASAFVLRLSREGLAFRAGQWVHLALPGGTDRREYTIYSSPEDPFLEVLVKEIPEGRLSPALRRSRPGEELELDGPHGGFGLVEGGRGPARYYFIATGTGISPYHSFAGQYVGMDYLLLHGVREDSELYDRDLYASGRYIPCLSRGDSREGGYAGRVTAYLAERPVDPAGLYYLCGNSDMIFEAHALLRKGGVPISRIRAEIYF